MCSEPIDERNMSPHLSIFNPLKPKLVYILFKNSVRTSKRTPYFTITKINWLTLFKDVITLWSKIIQNPYIQNSGLLTAKGAGTYSYHLAWIDTDRRNLKESERNMSHCNFVHHKPTWTDLGANSDPHGEKTETYRLCYGKAIWK
jgi:hypothetical protein